MSLGRRAGAEGLAAFALVFAGCGAIVADAHYGGVLGVVGIGLVFGLIIMAMVYATGHLSGAHINPAVTMAFTLTRHFSPRDAVAYITAQLAGAAAAAVVLLAVWPDQPAELSATVPSVAAMNPARSFGPALAAGEWTDFWVYLAGPLVGAGLGALAYQVVRGESA